MESTISAEQVESIIRNLHYDPFQILGPHEIEVKGRKNWVVRAFVPDSTEVYLVDPKNGKEYRMRSAHNELRVFAERSRGKNLSWTEPRSEVVWRFQRQHIEKLEEQYGAS